MHYRHLLLLCAILGSILTSCGGKKDTATITIPTNDSIIPNLDSIAAQLEQAHHYRFLYVSPLSPDSTFTGIYISPAARTDRYFYGDTLVAVYAAHYRLAGNQATSLQSHKLDEVEWTYFEVDSASIQTLTIDRKPYFYFAAQKTYMGKAVREQQITFYLIDINATSGHLLTYTGLHDFKCDECILGSFPDKSAWSGPAALYDTLLALSSKSKLIYHPGSEDANPYAWQNYETKWSTDNKSDNTFGAGHASLATPIHTTYYQTNLFGLNQGSVTDSIDNERYTIVSYFRSNLVGYDKQKRLYFPIVIESCNYSCGKAVTFVSGDRIRISYEDEDEEATELSLKDDLIFDASIGK